MPHESKVYRQIQIEQILETMRKAMVIRNYAPKTIATYLSVLSRFLEQLRKPVEEVTQDDIQDWQYSLVNEKHVSWSLFNQMVCALRFYFKHVCFREWDVAHIPFMRKRRQLPSIFYLHVAAHHLQTVKNPLDDLPSLAAGGVS